MNLWPWRYPHYSRFSKSLAIRSPGSRYTWPVFVLISFAHWTGKRGGGCHHGACSQSWPWWKIAGALWCRITVNPDAPCRRLWIYTRRGAVFFDCTVDRRDIARDLGRRLRKKLPFDFRAHLVRQRKFSLATFGPGYRYKANIDHIRKELVEIEKSPDDLVEWIDVVILALDAAWRQGATPDEIIDALVAKQTKNEKRQWPNWRYVPTDKAIEHDRAGE